MDRMLDVVDLTAGYGDMPVLHGISFDLEHDGALAILGRNGVGKTSLLRALMGLIKRFGGSVRLNDSAIDAKRPFERARLGLALVPQEREIFPSLTVEENLTVARRPGAWTIDRVFDLLPGIARRRNNPGDRLSGGEQQMLALGRALVGNPRMLLLDEPFEGLAPAIVEGLAETLMRLRRSENIAIIIVEHHVDLALEMTNRCIVLDRGQIAWSGLSDALKTQSEILSVLIGLDEPDRPDQNRGGLHDAL